MPMEPSHRRPCLCHAEPGGAFDRIDLALRGPHLGERSHLLKRKLCLGESYRRHMRVFECTSDPRELQSGNERHPGRLGRPGGHRHGTFFGRVHVVAQRCGPTRLPCGLRCRCHHPNARNPPPLAGLGVAWNRRLERRVPGSSGTSPPMRLLPAEAMIRNPNPWIVRSERSDPPRSEEDHANPQGRIHRNIHPAPQSHPHIGMDSFLGQLSRLATRDILVFYSFIER